MGEGRIGWMRKKRRRRNRERKTKRRNIKKRERRRGEEKEAMKKEDEGKEEKGVGTDKLFVIFSGNTSKGEKVFLPPSAPV